MRRVRKYCVMTLLLCLPVYGQESSPFLAGYVHLGKMFNVSLPEPDREQQIAAYLDQFARSGLRVIMPYITGGDGAVYFPSEHINFRPFGSWDPVAVVAREARERGLLFFPAVSLLSSGGKVPKGILSDHPEWALRDAEGKSIGFISPGHPDARHHLHKLLLEIVERYRPEGILFDQARYPNQPVDLDAGTCERFRAESGRERYDIASRSDATWQRFKEECLTGFMAELSRELRAASPFVKLGLFTWGPHVAQGHYLAQNWPEWVRQGYIDIVNVSGYCYPDNYGAAYLTILEKRLRGAKRLIPENSNVLLTFCVGIRTSHGSVASAAQIQEYLNIGKRAGMEGVSMYTFAHYLPFIDGVLGAKYLETFAEGLPPITSAPPAPAGTE